MALMKRSPEESSPTAERRCHVLGVEYLVADMETATAAVINRALSGEGGYCSLAGVHGIVTAQRRSDLKAALDNAWANLADGEPVAWMMRRMGERDARRVAGPDLMPSVIDAGQAHGLRHFLFGSTNHVLDRLTENLRRRYPRVQIAGAISPPFRPLSDQEEDEITTQIRSSGAHLVWVGLGLPKQDEWMCRNSDRLAPCVAMGVGAAFDFLAETKPRAPLWMRQRGLEWLHRMATEPRRLGWRYASTNSEFIVRATPQLIHHWYEHARGTNDAARS